jgi:hypothetical protein
MCAATPGVRSRTRCATSSATASTTTCGAAGASTTRTSSSWACCGSPTATSEELSNDAEMWQEAPLVLQAASPTVRQRILEMVFEPCVRGSAWPRATSTAPSSTASRPPATPTCASPGASARTSSRWPRTGSSRSVKPRDEDRRNVEYLVSGSARSKLGRLLKQPATWREEDEADNPHAARIKDEHYQDIITALLKAAKTYGLVVPKRPSSA